MKQSTETKTELLLKDLLDAWGASQDSLNQAYALSNVHHHLPKLVRETANQFCLTETDVTNFLRTKFNYDSLITIDYHELAEQFTSMAALKENS
ncbi:MAG: hypothetical protein ACFE0I_24195 [Elainellaceae cyanobacterium]